MEEIGKVKLDYSRYPGEDLYCDGSVEDEILEIVKEFPPAEHARIIEEKRSWPVLYHLSPLRENIVDWLPMGPEDKVLEVGSGCGAITGAFARKAGSVTCVDLSKKRSLINAYRHKDCDNVTIHVGNFKDVEPDLPRDYDYICLIGVFEYGQSYIGGNTPFEDFLKILVPHLAKEGRIVIAIENKYGLKYFAGCAEDHLGTYFSGIENYADGGGVRTFSRKGLERIFRSCGVGEARFYYPYPDYKFMTALYSDAYLPGKGELSNNFRNFDRDRLLLFDEKSAFDGIAEDGLFPIFANSFVAVLGGELPVKYVKYSNDRAPEHAIRTEISRTSDGRVQVRKYPLSWESIEHVRGMEAAYGKLREKYQGGKLEINRCELVENGREIYTQYEFVQGTPLSELMDGCLEQGDVDGFYRYFREYLERIAYHEDYPVADYDLIFGNILVNGSTWTVIDYEWTFGRPMSARELAFRAVYCYLLEDGRREKVNLDAILKELKITPEEAERYREKERDFQGFVTGSRLSMAQVRELLGHAMIRPSEWLPRYYEAARVNRVQVFEDRGDGYREEGSRLFPEAFQGDHLIELNLRVDGDVRMLRIDPAFDSCVIRILNLEFNGEEIPLNRKFVRVNGKVAKPSTVIFPTEDPGINLLLEKLPRKEQNSLHARMEIARLPLAVAEAMAGAVKPWSRP